MQADWITTRKVVDSRLVQPIASRDGPPRGHSRALSLVDGAESFETYSKNLNWTSEEHFSKEPSPATLSTGVALWTTLDGLPLPLMPLRACAMTGAQAGRGPPEG